MHIQGGNVLEDKEKWIAQHFKAFSILYSNSFIIHICGMSLLQDIFDKLVVIYKEVSRRIGDRDRDISGI